MTTVALCWYATAGYQHQDLRDARAYAPWYRDKAQPSIADMHAKLRRVIITAQFRGTDPEPATDRPPKRKSTSCGWPGLTSPHKRALRTCGGGWVGHAGSR